MINYKKDRQDLGYLPSDGEGLRAYVERLRNVAQQQRYSYAPSHENWFTHYSPSSCWICNLLDLTDYLVSAMSDIVSEDKKHLWKCHKPVGQNDPMMFTFKPQKV